MIRRAEAQRLLIYDSKTLMILWSRDLLQSKSFALFQDVFKTSKSFKELLVCWNISTPYHLMNLFYWFKSTYSSFYQNSSFSWNKAFTTIRCTRALDKKALDQRAELKLLSALWSSYNTNSRALLCSSKHLKVE